MMSEKTYSHRQELVEFALTLALEVSNFVRQHPEAIPSLVSLWFDVRNLIAQERNYPD